MVVGFNPATMNDWLVPLIRGVGSPDAWVIEAQVVVVIGAVEYLMS